MSPLLFGLAYALTVNPPPTPVTGHAGHADTLGKGNGIVGVFRPLSIGVSDRVDLSTSGLATLVAPRVDAKVNLMSEPGGSVALTGGIGVPTVGLRLLRGTVLPSDPTLTVGLGVVAKLGLIGTVHNKGNAMSLGVEVRSGGHGGTLQAVDLPFVSQSLAPLLEGPVLRWRWVTDFALSKRATLTSDVALQVGAGGPDALWRTFLLGGSDHLAAGVGWAIADENLSYGRDSLGMPLLDLQARW
jgi:hypothetical protein